MSQLCTEKPVCVTGASGFVASWIVKDLLRKGYQVKGTVRDGEDPARYPELRNLEGADERLTLVTADLLEPDSFGPAIEGCEIVLHTASPYALTVEDPQRDLVDPALKGTEAVLGTCLQQGVKRVVLTSSIAAVTDEPEPGQVMDESVWNEKSSLSRNPYYYSKTLAEKAAWSLLEGTSLEMVVINPSLVIGPSLIPGLNTSNKVIRDLLAGAYPGLVDLAWALVDVRDVSRAHLKAMENDQAEGRYICSHQTLTMREVVERLRDLGFEDYPMPRLRLDSALGSLLVRAASAFQPAGTRTFLRTNLGRPPRFDNSKVLGLLEDGFTPLETTLKDTVADLIRWKHLGIPS